MRLVATLVMLAVVTASAAANTVEPVEIPHGDATLRGFVYRPEGPGPFPSVVALHGCGGLLNSSGRIGTRFADWGDRLAAAGIAAVFPDSFASRGLSGQCRVRERRVRSARERVADAHAARHWLQGQAWTVKNRVSLMGWSSGGIATLWAV